MFKLYCLKFCRSSKVDTKFALSVGDKSLSNNYIDVKLDSIFLHQVNIITIV